MPFEIAVFRYMAARCSPCLQRNRRTACNFKAIALRSSRRLARPACVASVKNDATYDWTSLISRHSDPPDRDDVGSGRVACFAVRDHHRARRADRLVATEHAGPGSGMVESAAPRKSVHRRVPRDRADFILHLVSPRALGDANRPEALFRAARELHFAFCLIVRDRRRLRLAVSRSRLRHGHVHCQCRVVVPTDLAGFRGTAVSPPWAECLVPRGHVLVAGVVRVPVSGRVAVTAVAVSGL